MRLTCVRLMPTARSSPSSRVRSKIDRPSVLAMPKSAMTTASDQHRGDEPQAAGSRSRPAARGRPPGPAPATLPNSVDRPLDRRLVTAAGSAPSATLTSTNDVELLPEELVVGLERDHVVAHEPVVVEGAADRRAGRSPIGRRTPTGARRPTDHPFSWPASRRRPARRPPSSGCDGALARPPGRRPARSSPGRSPVIDGVASRRP